jgi:hypothetical protein
MELTFVKNQFEIAKKASHLSETIVIDIKTVEWMISKIEHSEKERWKTAKNLFDCRKKLKEIKQILSQTQNN